MTLSVGLSVFCLQKNLKMERSRFCDYIVSACAMGPVVYFSNGRTCSYDASHLLSYYTTDRPLFDVKWSDLIGRAGDQDMFFLH